MEIDPRTAAVAKDRAESYFSRGMYREALSAYETVRGYGDRDPKIHLRMGDIARRLGDERAAVVHYKDASLSFAGLGFALKAIAVLKMILQIDPSEEETRSRLTGLCVSGPAPGGGGRPGKGGGTGSGDGEEGGVPRVPLFSDFTEPEFHHVVGLVSSRKIGAGEMLFSEGERGDSIFFISEGSAEVVCGAGGPVERTLATLDEGAVFGEFGFFSGSRRSAGVRAAGELTVLELKRADLEEAIRAHPRVKDVLFNFYKERVADRLMALSGLFAPLSADERKAVLDGAGEVGFTAGSRVLEEGEPGGEMYLIISGSAEVSVRDRDGKVVEVSALSEGDFFGEVALATNRPRVASVTAKTDLRLVEFPRRTIRSLVSSHPGIRESLERVIKERVLETVSAREHRAALI